MESSPPVSAPQSGAVLDRPTGIAGTVQPGLTPAGSHALTGYQTQLSLLEQQNKQRAVASTVCPTCSTPNEVGLLTIVKEHVEVIDDEAGAQLAALRAPHDMNAIPEQIKLKGYPGATQRRAAVETAVVPEPTTVRAPHDMNALPEENEEHKHHRRVLDFVSTRDQGTGLGALKRRQELQSFYQQGQLHEQHCRGASGEPTSPLGSPSPLFAPASFEYDEVSSANEVAPAVQPAEDELASMSAHLGYAPARSQQQFAPASFEYNWIPSEMPSGNHENKSESSSHHQEIPLTPVQPLVKRSNFIGHGVSKGDNSSAQLKRLGTKAAFQPWSRCRRGTLPISRNRNKTASAAKRVALSVISSPTQVLFAESPTTPAQGATDIEINRKDISVHDETSLAIRLRIDLPKAD